MVVVAKREVRAVVRAAASRGGAARRRRQARRPSPCSATPSLRRRLPDRRAVLRARSARACRDECFLGARHPHRGAHDVLDGRAREVRAARLVTGHVRTHARGHARGRVTLKGAHDPAREDGPPEASCWPADWRQCSPEDVTSPEALETGRRGAPVDVDEHPADHVVRGRRDRKRDRAERSKPASWQVSQMVGKRSARCAAPGAGRRARRWDGRSAPSPSRSRG